MGQELVLSMDQRSLVAPRVEQDADLRVYLNVLRRRYLSFIIPAVLVFTAICAVTFFVLPSVYEATAKILVESQMIPSELASSSVTTSATERVVELIRQRLMTRDNLLEIARKYELYPKQRLSPSEMIDKIREGTKVEELELTATQAQRAQALGYQAQQARPGMEALGFTLSFDYYDPAIASKVANGLVSSILEQNLRARTGRAEQTSKFFAQQSSKLEQDLGQLEKRISDFKKANEGALPDSLFYRRTQLAKLQSDLAPIDQRIALGTDQQQITESKQQLLGLNGQLDALKQQLKIVSDQRTEVAPLFDKGLITKNRLLELDIRMAQLQGEVQATTTSIAIEQGKLSSHQIQIERTSKLHAQLAEKIAALNESILKTPEVEAGLASLRRAYENLQTQYRLTKAKTTVATTGEQMEEDRQAVRFEVIEQAIVPTKPASPDRPRILLGGAFASIAAGVGLVFLLESLDKSIRSSADLERLLHTRPLATIPYVTTPQERQRKKWKAFLASFLFMVGIGLVLVHELYRPLDDLAQRLLELLSLYGWR